VKKYLSEYPELVSEWHPTKNNHLKPPEKYTHGSGELVWWKYPKGDDHEWDAYIFNRTREIGGTGCPVCAGQQISKVNNLQVLKPKLASEWHPTKNGDKKPEEFLQYSNEKVRWQCSKNENHEFQADIRNRNRKVGGGCVLCSSQRKIIISTTKIKKMREDGISYKKISEEVELNYMTVYRALNIVNKNQSKM